LASSTMHELAVKTLGKDGETDNSTLCGMMRPRLASGCSCSSADHFDAGQIDCGDSGSMLVKFSLQLNVLPCSNHPHLRLEVLDTSGVVNFTEPDIRTGTDKEYEIPGLSFGTPGGGRFGAVVHVEYGALSGSPDLTHLSVTIDVCGVFGKRICGKELGRMYPGLGLPYDIVTGDFQFDKLCHERVSVDCGNGATCPPGTRCASKAEGAGVRFGCLPEADAISCDHPAYSCGAGSRCDMVARLCHSPVGSTPLLENSNATLGEVHAGRGFCGVLRHVIPSICQCTDFAGGGVLNCGLHLFGQDLRISFEVDLCGAVSHVTFRIVDVTAGLAFSYTIRASAYKRIDIPYLVVTAPKYGKLHGVAVLGLSGSLDALTLALGLDVCAQLNGTTICGSDIAGYFPFWVADERFRFGNLCRAEEAVRPCGNGHACLASERCASRAKGAGLLQACAPRDNKLCSDSRYSCPLDTSCNMSAKKCQKFQPFKSEPGVGDLALEVNKDASTSDTPFSMGKGYCSRVVPHLFVTCECSGTENGATIKCDTDILRQPVTIALKTTTRCGPITELSVFLEDPIGTSPQPTWHREVKLGESSTFSTDVRFLALKRVVDNTTATLTLKGTNDDLTVEVVLNACVNTKCGERLYWQLPYEPLTPNRPLDFSNVC